MPFYGTPPAITDRTALARNRARALDDALFLHDITATELKERLSEVNKTFTKVGIVTGFPRHWQNAYPEATVGR